MIIPTQSHLLQQRLDRSWVAREQAPSTTIIFVVSLDSHKLNHPFHIYSGNNTAFISFPSIRVYSASSLKNALNDQLFMFQIQNNYEDFEGQDITIGTLS